MEMHRILSDVYSFNGTMNSESPSAPPPLSRKAAMASKLNRKFSISPKKRTQSSTMDTENSEDNFDEEASNMPQTSVTDDESENQESALESAVKGFPSQEDREALLSRAACITKQYKCDLCHLIFALRRVLEVHKMLEHRVEPQWTCRTCGMQFLAQECYDDHILSSHNPRSSSSSNSTSKPSTLIHCPVSGCSSCFVVQSRLDDHMLKDHPLSRTSDNKRELDYVSLMVNQHLEDKVKRTVVKVEAEEDSLGDYGGEGEAVEDEGSGDDNDDDDDDAEDDAEDAVDLTYGKGHINTEGRDKRSTYRDSEEASNEVSHRGAKNGTQIGSRNEKVVSKSSVVGNKSSGVKMIRRKGKGRIVGRKGFPRAACYKCPHCTGEYTHACHLKYHMRIHSGEKPFKCSMCPATFSRSNTRTKHFQRVHLKLRPHLCDFCGKKFGNKKSLQEHVMAHLGIKRYECSVCQKRFGKSGALKTHLRQHTGAKPYVCEHCGQAFTVNVSLRTHLKNKHGVIVPTGYSPRTDPNLPTIGRPKQDQFKLKSNVAADEPTSDHVSANSSDGSQPAVSHQVRQSENRHSMGMPGLKLHSAENPGIPFPNIYGDSRFHAAMNEPVEAHHSYPFGLGNVAAGNFQYHWQ